MRNGAFKCRTRAQSAMEYLMTYGWAILVIAIIVSLLFALGLFSGGAGTPDVCTPQSGFSCTNPSYGTNGISATISQTSGSYYTSAWVFIVSSSELIGSSGLPVNFSASSTANMLYLGQLGPSQTVLFTYTNTSAGEIPTANIPVGYPFTGYVWLGYCTTPGCNSPTSFAKVGTINVKEAGTAFVGGSTIISNGPPTTSTSTTSTSTTSTSSTSIYLDPLFCDACTGDVVFDSNMVSTGLTNDIVTTGSVTVLAGANLLTNGYSIISGNTFTNDGTVDTGNATNGGSGGGYYSISYGNPIPSAYGGGTCSSNPPCFGGIGGGGGGAGGYGGAGGGGAGGNANACNGGNGGTRGTGGASGAAGTAGQAGQPQGNSWGGGGGGGGGGSTLGASPGAQGGIGAGSNTSSQCNWSFLNVSSAGTGQSSYPSPILSSVQTWYANKGGALQSYLEGAGGGGGGGNGCCGDGGTGGGGGYGIYIQANQITPGTINAAGASGAGGGSGGGAGGGGGGFVILAYGSSIGSVASVSVSGGARGEGQNGGPHGSSGGSGITVQSQWSTPPITP